MKIGDIRASLHRHEIDLPGIGKSIESRMFVFVEVETDEGLKGFGITGSILPWAVIACIEHHLAPALKGRDALHTEAIHYCACVLRADGGGDCRTVSAGTRCYRRGASFR